MPAQHESTRIAARRKEDAARRKVGVDRLLSTYEKILKLFSISLPPK